MCLPNVYYIVWCSAHVHGAGDVRGDAGGRAHARGGAAGAGRVRRRRARRHAAAHGAPRRLAHARPALGARRGGGLPRRLAALRQGLLQNLAAGEIHR